MGVDIIIKNCSLVNGINGIYNWHFRDFMHIMCLTDYCNHTIIIFIFSSLTVRICRYFGTRL